MITSDDLKIVINIRKRREAIRQQLKRRRNPIEGQERAELIALDNSLEDEEIEAENRLLKLAEMLDNWRLQYVFEDVFVGGWKKREIAGWMGVSEQYVGRLAKAAIEELNRKGATIEAAPADHLSFSIR